MKPVDFPESNAEHGDGSDAVPVYVKGDGGYIISWGLSLRERLSVLFTGRVWTHTNAEGQVSASAQKPDPWPES